MRSGAPSSRGTASSRVCAARRSDRDAASAALFQPQVIDEIPFVVMVFVVEFLDRLIFFDAGNADDLATANSLAIADVRWWSRYPGNAVQLL